ncbi:MAG: hypothetical protein JWN24_977 [Phycisphaerales bacterium]|nr:hypothetical protein [Phycisphaerales bacterium]
MADPFQIRYAPKAADDIRGFRAFDRKRMLDAVEQHLRFAPAHCSTSRIKRMIQPFWSQYRLRTGDFRVYYDVDETDRVVSVLRVLFKGSGQTPEQSP